MKKKKNKWKGPLPPQYLCAKCGKIHVVTPGGFCATCTEEVMVARNRRLAAERSGDIDARIKSGWAPMGNGCWRRNNTQDIRLDDNQYGVGIFMASR